MWPSLTVPSHLHSTVEYRFGRHRLTAFTPTNPRCRGRAEFEMKWHFLLYPITPPTICPSCIKCYKILPLLQNTTGPSLSLIDQLHNARSTARVFVVCPLSKKKTPPYAVHIRFQHSLDRSSPIRAGTAVAGQRPPLGGSCVNHVSIPE